MRAAKHICSTAAALRTVFVPQFETRSLQFASRQWPPKRCSTHLSPFSTTARRSAYMVTPKDAPVKSRSARNEEIISYSCVVVNPDGTLTDPLQTSYVLSKTDLSTEALITVSEIRDPRQEPPCPYEIDDPRYYEVCKLPLLPLVKIINKAEEYKKEKEAKKRKKEGSASKVRKTIEINWAIEKGDYGHRMDSLRKFLSKGYKVDVVLAKKKKGKPVTEDVAKDLIKRIQGVIAEEGKGWKEAKPLEGKVGGSLTIFAEGKVDKSAGDNSGSEDPAED
jgi:translation initiation factor IF-3